MDASRREPLRILAEFLEARLDESHLVLVVVDREAGRVAQPLPRGAASGQAAWKVRIQIARAVWPSMALEPLAHLPAALFVNVIARISFGFTRTRE